LIELLYVRRTNVDNSSNEEEEGKVQAVVMGGIINILANVATAVNRCQSECFQKYSEFPPTPDTLRADN